VRPPLELAVRSAHTTPLRALLRFVRSVLIVLAVLVVGYLVLGAVSRVWAGITAFLDGRESHGESAWRIVVNSGIIVIGSCAFEGLARFRLRWSARRRDANRT
jgi:hypothetical protein